MQPLRPSCRPALAVAGLALLAFALGGCGASPTPPEDELFREASLALEGESYTTAIGSYKKLLEEYPFSDKAEIASLNIAYAHYLNEQYAEAIASFNDFERLYPISPLLPFVSYSIGMCWLEQSKDASRDDTPAVEALRQFKKVASEFPKTIYADLATFRQDQAREDISAHELLVGDYYRDRKRAQAAEARYRYILDNFPNTENAKRASSRLDSLVEIAAAEQKSAEDVAQEAADKAAAEAKKEQAQGRPADNKLLAEPAVSAPTPDTPPGDPSASKPVPPSADRAGQ